MGALRFRAYARNPDAPGSQFAESVAHAERDEREPAILSQLLDSNVPDFLRRLVPVFAET
jgi:hypothetical protein